MVAYAQIKGIFFGLRINFGVRITEPFSETNRSSGREAFTEISIPFDFGYEIYPPLAFYIRPEILNLGFKGIGYPSGYSRVTVDSLLTGHGNISFGFRLDLAGIL